MQTPAALLVVIGLIATSAAAELYKWVDKDGRITYSDTPPPADARRVEKKRFLDRVAEGDGLSFASQNAMKKHPVSLFATDCGEPCDRAKALLAKRGVPHALKNPETNLIDGNELKKLVGALEVPALQVGKNGIKGFNESAWHAALDAAGYPKSAGPLKAGAAKESKDAHSVDGKAKSRKEEIGGKQNQANKTAVGTRGNNASALEPTDNAPSFSNKADSNARSGPYHEPKLPASTTNDKQPTRINRQKTPGELGDEEK
jgi:hypothetical protein